MGESFLETAVTFRRNNTESKSAIKCIQHSLLHSNWLTAKSENRVILLQCTSQIVAYSVVTAQRIMGGKQSAAKPCGKW